MSLIDRELHVLMKPDNVAWDRAIDSCLALHTLDTFMILECGEPS
tara:strand:+ start:246 stop:380 length:135 start_codon:yes stop_codon:yes gene_type:complete